MKKIIITLILVLVFVIGCGNNKLKDQIDVDLSEKVDNKKIDVCLLSIEEVKEKCNLVENIRGNIEFIKSQGQCIYEYMGSNGKIHSGRILEINMLYNNKIDYAKNNPKSEPVQVNVGEAYFLNETIIQYPDSKYPITINVRDIYVKKGEKAFIIKLKDVDSQQPGHFCSINDVKELANLIVKRID